MDYFKTIGITVRTTNKDNHAAQDIGSLWARFMSENLRDMIPHKINDNIYLIYSDYESNYQGEYTCMLGCKVDQLDNIPPGFVGRKFPAQKERHYVAVGELPASVVNVWKEIWQDDDTLNRLYKYDYEVYTPKAFTEKEPKVDIYIGVE